MANENVTIDRNKYVGGSDLPTILGLNVKYGKKPFDLALEKAQIVKRENFENEYTKYGHKMEPIIRDYINAKYQAHYVEDTVVDEEGHCRGNTDGIDREVEIPIIEIKTFGEELDVPYYTPQCQFYLEKFNQPSCRIIGYKRPGDFYTGVDFKLENDDRYFNYDFDPENLEEHIIYRDEKVWTKIQSRITAFLEGVEYLRNNKDNYTEEEFNKIFYGTHLLETVSKVADLEHKLTELKLVDEYYKKAKEDLYKLFEEKGIISFENDNIKITKVNPTSYDTISINAIKLKEENEEIYNKYKTVKTTNKKGYVLITTKNKEDKE